MKKYLLLFVSVALGSLLAGCNQQSSPSTPSAASTASAEKSSFKEVTARLDAGGDFYLYFGTQQILEGVSTNIDQLRDIVVTLPDLTADDRVKAGKALDLLGRFARDSGVEDITGLGMSSIATEKGFYRSRVFAHHYPGHGDGVLWKAFGEKPHPLTGLDLLSTNTVLASFGDADLTMMWSFLRREIDQADLPKVKTVLDQLPAEFEKSTGLKWDQVLHSLDGEFGFVLTLDPTRMVSIPGKNLQIPDPAALLVIKTTDDTIFNRLDRVLSDTVGKTGMQIDRKDEAGLKMRTVLVPPLLPVTLRPSIASAGGYLLIATSDAAIRDALAVKAGKTPGIKSTDEFKRLARNIPDEGNQFSFVSQRFAQTLRKVQQEALEAKSPSAATRKLAQTIFDPAKAGYLYSVGGNTPEGWLVTANGNQHSGHVLLASAIIVPVAALSAIAVPNFVKARTTSQKNGCINNLRMIDAAKAQWALENKKNGDETPTQAELLPYLKGRWPVCPSGGRYTIGNLHERPRCSMAGHVLL
jgi:hypothetical protein